MVNEQYVWLIWASAFLIPWVIIYIAYPQHRRAMIWSSIFTTPFGLTEPLFVPEYWSPPSLFDLAIKTGFDIESLIFCFGIGGVGSVLYNLFTKQVPVPVLASERSKPIHRHHYKALSAPIVAFPILYFLPFENWNPIYPSIIAMIIGTIANVLCRPDLKRKSWIGGLLFLSFYVIFLVGLEFTAPGYIERVWNLDALSGINILFMPIEEILFAFTFGMYWSGVYEHFTWRS
ncbi:hypothetical protein MNBD_GAMMA22-668 [hydrothermal vent metagenome]|uniref:Lycopene cyclase domain-containing protein n=1 Tax=hydrothermal vent metagenome TaxID=652676 RepID=A0A3B0ZNB5_9ZZZZ